MECQEIEGWIGVLERGGKCERGSRERLAGVVGHDPVQGIDTSVILQQRLKPILLQMLVVSC